MIKIIKGRDYSKYFDVIKDNKGKPFLTNGKYISVSHFEGRTLIITSKKNLGIDVEKIKKVKPSLKKYFNLENLSDINFLKEWTRREAVIKRDNLKLGEIKDLKIKGKVNTYLLFPYIISIAK